MCPIDILLLSIAWVRFIKIIPSIIPNLYRPNEIEVFNVTANEKKKRKLGYVLEAMKKFNFEIPAQVGLWYPDGAITTNKVKHKINVALFHWLPAYFIDFLMFCFRQKRLYVSLIGTNH